MLWIYLIFYCMMSCKLAIQTLVKEWYVYKIFVSIAPGADVPLRFKSSHYSKMLRGWHSQNRQLYHPAPGPLSVSHSGPQAKHYENL